MANTSSKAAGLLDSIFQWNSAQHPVEELLLTAGLFIAALILFSLLRKTLGNRLTAWAETHSEAMDSLALRQVLSAFFWLAVGIAVYVFFKAFPFAPRFMEMAGTGFLIYFTILGLSLGFGLLRFFLDVYLRRKGSSLKEHKGRAVLPVVKILIWLVAAMFILDNMGLKIGTILAGLGVAGIAVGFAAQAILGDLFSYFAILFDRPFRIGDFIFLSADVRGTIEHIGLKTSRIRSLDGEQIILSNSDLTGSRVKNYRRMFRRRVVFGFGVIYSTPHAELAAIPGYVREIINATPKASLERAHFARFGESSLDFEVVYYVLSPEYQDYMDVQQAINLALVKRFEEHGIDFAFPTRTLHHASPAPAEGAEENHA
ncbi:mechanosensitive ion channel family protein [Pseudodesulfovibrio tunisiensis]|uniref:mechanosensitive ion channel family protein n=1 Tax=Pseudodesulfovibrio tunisiensis TaxID=463192 RepID=UPI001FB35629|nr:mechanosensitive ion channel family protein [Pseudodesulfovibrio tunisiensis]